MNIKQSRTTPFTYVLSRICEITDRLVEESDRYKIVIMVLLTHSASSSEVNHQTVNMNLRQTLLMKSLVMKSLVLKSLVMKILVTKSLMLKGMKTSMSVF